MIRCDFNAEKVILIHYYTDGTCAARCTWTYRTSTLLIFICIILCVRAMRIDPCVGLIVSGVVSVCPDENQSSVHTRSYITTPCQWNCARYWSSVKCDLIWCVCLPASQPASHPASTCWNIFGKNHFGISSDLINVVHRSSLPPSPPSSMCRGCHRLHVCLSFVCFQLKSSNTHALYPGSHSNCACVSVV